MPHYPRSYLQQPRRASAVASVRAACNLSSFLQFHAAWFQPSNQNWPLQDQMVSNMASTVKHSLLTACHVFIHGSTFLFTDSPGNGCQRICIAFGGAFKKMSYIPLVHKRSLYTPAQHVLTIFLQRQPCFTFPALDIILCFLE